MDRTPDPRAGHQIITLEFVGEGVDLLDHEAGGHRLQRVPPTERRGRVHSSTVTVAVLREKLDEPVYQRRAPDDFVVEWYSGSGAGGQHRNRHMCSVRLRHIPTGIVKQAQTRSRDNSLRSARAALDLELDQLAQNAASVTENCLRRTQVGAGQRSDKRRTVRFQDGWVVDHLTGKRIPVANYMRGEMDRLW